MLRWFSHIERMNSEEFVEKVLVSEMKGHSRKGRPLGRWKDRVKECMSERGGSRGAGLEQGRRECLDRERWRLSAVATPLGDSPGESKASKL